MRWLLPLFLLLITTPSRAQDLLPQGVGLYQFGYRDYAEQVDNYDGSGAKVPLSDRFGKELTGPNLLQGKGGADLKRLADELKKFDGQNNGGASLLNQLDLGQIEGDVTANVEAQIFALAFGFTPKLTGFIGVPMISASVKADIRHSGRNNALQIKEQLGDLAFDELKAGLDQASAISSAQVKANIADAGFAPIDEWSHKGMGDMRVGFKSGLRTRLGRVTGYGLGVTTTLEIPTGYVDDPDILTDVSLGRGYYSLGVQVDQKFRFFRTFFVGADVGYNENFSAEMEKRLPIANENIVAADRKTNVTIQPGDDMDVAASLGYAGDLISANWRAGTIRHFSDAYSGDLEGNYAKLSEGSSKYQAYHEFRLSLSTVKAYQRGFPIPFILTAMAHQPLQGRNISDERFYELSLASFFSTPIAKEQKANGKRQRKQRRRGGFARR